MKRHDLPAVIQQKLSFLHTIFINKYGFDKFNEIVFAGGSRRLGNLSSVRDAFRHSREC
jgi:NADH-quinone oxidoreductase subunit L